MTSQLRVLDAGCGRHTHSGYRGLDLGSAYVVGLDVSETSLDQHPRLDEKVAADLQGSDMWLLVDLGSFDVVICQDVLEHLPRPTHALRNIAVALKPGGELILSCSNPASIKGLITKFTPLLFHRFVRKRGWFGYRYYDDPTYGPFKTYLRWSIRPKALERTLRQLGFAEIDVRVEDFGRVGWLGRRSEIKLRARKA